MTPPLQTPAPDAAFRRHRRCLAATALTAAAAIALSAGTAAHAAPASTLPHEALAAADGDAVSSFILPILPDTQFYSRYSASQFMPNYGTNPFEVQTQWIVENQDQLNMPFTVHVGDVVDQQGVQGEWDAAEQAMRILSDGNMPYSIVPGNHDVMNSGGRSNPDNSRNYLARFGAETLAAQAGETLIDTFEDGLSSAYLFEAEGRTWMSLALAWNASDETFDWAQGILDAHPNTPVVLSSHAIISIGDDQQTAASWWWGEELWENLVRGNDQIILTVNGHFHGATSQTRLNDFGNPVHQVLTDYQMSADGGNGIMTLFEFDLSNNRIDVETVSPWVPLKHAESLTSSDTPVLTGPGQSFSLELDFDERFGWTLDPAEEDGPDLSELAKQIVSEGWDGDMIGSALVPAGNAADYPIVDGTLAHWRFGDVDAGTVMDDTVIPDAAGDNPLHRPHIDDTAAPEEWDDMAIDHDNSAFYSADAGAVCFANVGRDAAGGPSRLSYLTTGEGSPVTNAEFTDQSGYTIETFVQLSEDWTEAQNRWSAALTRGGIRSEAGIHDNADPGAGTAWLGISNLREYQFSAADTRSARSYTLWSGEIMPASWHHVAIVNDPERDAATMYVDGVPVLRNGANVGGMMSVADAPWILGASLWNAEPSQGWHGCIGETRIVDRPLDTDEFLYNRVNIDTDGPNFGITTDLTAPLVDIDGSVTITGTGYPGASIRVENAEDAATTTVDDEGKWTLPLDTNLAAPGENELTIVQALGSRDGNSTVITVLVAETEEPGDGGDGGSGEGDGGAGGSGEGEDDGEDDGNGSGEGDAGDSGDSDSDSDEQTNPGDDNLATTGGAAGPLAVLAALGLAASGIGLVLRRRARLNRNEA
ncbi:LamG-like jellyroll fold domain-containing protein [Microbacterium sp. YY-01]|uniref:LamG-like jellyroll fold domain-containing protein n=1 Tax=Microbacterium sp. YY-01 TaxID=3421634 RepID=UPI003D16D4D2